MSHEWRLLHTSKLRSQAASCDPDSVQGPRGAPLLLVELLTPNVTTATDSVLCFYH